MDNIKNTMLISPDDLKASTYVNYNVDDSMAGASIREAQEIHLQSVIGSNLLYRLQELVYNAIMDEEDNIDESGNTLYKELLDEYVQPYLNAKAQAALCLPISLKLRNYGVAKDSDTNIQATTVKEIMVLQKRYNTIADRKATILSKYLCIHKNDFPELEETECGCGIFVPAQLGKRFVNIGLWLGGKDNKCSC